MLHQLPLLDLAAAEGEDGHDLSGPSMALDVALSTKGRR